MYLDQFIRFFRIELLNRSDNIVVRRKGIYWHLDLKEGIDFSIWLRGGFELSALRLYHTLIREKDIVLDIGANIGAHTLHFAKIVGKDGKVYAFEPTDYAFYKLDRNLSLNPELARQVDHVQAYLVDSASSNVTREFYSSWPLIDRPGLHEYHRGELKSAAGAYSMTLDKFIAKNRISRVDFIKLDVDGNEIEVLFGGLNTIQRFKPNILMELAPYLFEKKMGEMEIIISKIISLGYEIKDPISLRPLPDCIKSLVAIVPLRGSINILLRAPLKTKLLIKSS